MNNTLKLWTPFQALLVSFIAGPFAGFWAIRENYLAAKDTKNAKRTLIGGVIITIIVILEVIASEYTDKFSPMTVHILYPIIIYTYCKRMEKIYLAPLLENGAEKQPGKRLLLLGLIFLPLQFTLTLLASFSLDLLLN